MKKLLLILITTILMVGCTSKLITLNEGVSKDTPITFGSIPSTEELVSADEETVITEELAGDKYIITATKGDKVETQEFTVDFETIDIDGTLPVDMNQFYSNPDKLAKVSYLISADETTMTVTDENGEEPHSFDVPVNVIYPEYTIAENITIDTYVGYDINEFVTAEEGVEVVSELDEENSLLNITLSKNDWINNVKKEVTIINSNPYPLNYVGYSPDVKNVTYYLTLNEDGTGFDKTNVFEGADIIWKMNDEYSGYFYWINGSGLPFPFTFNENKTELIVRTSTKKFNGTYGYVYYTKQ